MLLEIVTRKKFAQIACICCEQLEKLLMYKRKRQKRRKAGANPRLRPYIIAKAYTKTGARPNATTLTREPKPDPKPEPDLELELMLELEPQAQAPEKGPFQDGSDGIFCLAVAVVLRAVLSRDCSR